MGTRFIEQYQIANMKLDIEDYTIKSKNHFMPQLPHKRFQCWVNGGGLEQSDTIEEARQILFQWATDRLNDDIYKLNGQLFIRLQTKHLLNDDINNLQEFKITF